MTRAYRLGTEFPHEGFVQLAIEKHFAGCAPLRAGTADFACFDSDGRRWIIEAKGRTSDVGLDFGTGLGQLLKGMREPDSIYALAMPDTPQFANQRARMADWVREVPNLHWLVIAADGTIRDLPPGRNE